MPAAPQRGPVRASPALMQSNPRSAGW
jgi:hypothetical protein